MKSAPEKKPYGKKIGMGLLCGALTSMGGYYAGVILCISEGYREEGLFGAAVGALVGGFIVGPYLSIAGFAVGMGWGYTRGLPTLNTLWENSINWLTSVSSQVRGKLPSLPTTGSIWNKLGSMVTGVTDFVFSKKSLPNKSLAVDVSTPVASSIYSNDISRSPVQPTLAQQRAGKAPISKPTSETPYNYNIDPETGADRSFQDSVRPPDVKTKSPSQSSYKSVFEKIGSIQDPAATSAMTPTRDIPPGVKKLSSPKVSEAGMHSNNGKKDKAAVSESPSWTDAIRSVFGMTKK